jgi:hypothetical protein
MPSELISAFVLLGVKMAAVVGPSVRPTSGVRGPRLSSVGSIDGATTCSMG